MTDVTIHETPPAIIEVVQGVQGRDGVAGKDGKDGADGPKGDTGATGPAGADGAKGDTGAAGAKGKDGRDGKDRPYLPVPDDLDDSGADFYYFGWADQGDSTWLIQRAATNTGQSQSATSGAADYATAWAGRTALEYS